ncbi:MAG: hypothetical protein QG625_36, partial [Cyanobacteriota bacterium erpe_2018_sw_39hr_WHONDRS-SW48-000098_B_bin.30]|nr:hypothetical protein [Cyanobacteriota bacterium erpe_2018_sw_39hr_WHONDRS-SW48-000098_B_bin.30]
DVIAFKWQELDLSEFDIRDDTTYEVIDSVWLLRQSRRPLERKQMQPAKY